MNDSNEDEDPDEHSSSERSSNLKFCAVAILVAGLALAAFIYPRGNGASGNDPADNADAPLSLQDSRRDSRELEIYNGKLGLLTDKWMSIGHAWMQPKPLAITIALASALAAAGLLAFAQRKPDETHEPDELGE